MFSVSDERSDIECDRGKAIEHHTDERARLVEQSIRVAVVSEVADSATPGLASAS